MLVYCIDKTSSLPDSVYMVFPNESIANISAPSSHINIWLAVHNNE